MEYGRRLQCMVQGWRGDVACMQRSCFMCSVHNVVLRVLQGMAMGAQANIVDSVHIFIAIAAHKGLAAYALGSSIVDSQVSDPYSSLMAPPMPITTATQDVRTAWNGLPPVCQHTKCSRVCAGREAEAPLGATRRGSGCAGKHAEVLDGDRVLRVSHACGDPAGRPLVQCLQQ